MPDRDQTIDLLRALRDVDVTPPTTEVLHARVSSAIAQEIERDSGRPFGRFAGRRRRIAHLGMSGLVPFAAVMLTLVVFIGAIVLLAGHRQSRSPSAPAAPNSRGALLSVLGVLRRPQTGADLRSPMIGQYLQHPDDAGLAALNGTPDLALIRRATVTPWGSPVYLVPNKPPTAAALARLKRQFPTLSVARLDAARREEGVTEVDRSGSGGDATAAEIEAGQAIGTEGAGRSFAGGATQTRVIAIVPDGVATVSFVDPRQPSPHRHSATVTVAVHGNVAAARLDRGGTGGSVPIPMIWFSSNGAVIKRIGDFRTVNQAVSQFAALRRPRTRADAIPAMTLGLLRQPIKELHADASASRRVFASPAETVWLLPASVRGRPGICILSQQRAGTGGGGGASCEQRKPGRTGIFILSMGGLRIQSVLTLATDLRVTLEDGHSYTLTPNADGALVRTLPRLIRHVAFVAG